MSKTIAASRETETSMQNFEGANPLSSRALFWRSRYLCKSDFLYHLPFVFWLTEVLRPTTVVELGLTDGQSYFGFCQAVDRLNLAARCYGIFTPAGKDAPPAVAQARSLIETHNEENYDEFSRLLRRPAASALSRFAPASIDVLLVDMGLTRVQMDKVLEAAAEKLSARGVLLLHGFGEGEKEEQAHEILDALSQSHKTVFLEEGSGLAMVLFGQEQSSRLRQFADLRIGTSEYQNTHLVFRRLGIGHFHEWSNRTSTRASQRLRQTIVALKAEVKELGGKQADLEERVGEKDRRLAQINRQIAALKKEQADQQQVLETLSREKEAAQAEVAGLQNDRDRLTAERDSLTAQKSVIAARADGLRDEMAALTDKYEALRGAYDILQGAQKALQQECDAHTRANKALEAEEAARTEELADQLRQSEAQQREISALADSLQAGQARICDLEADLKQVQRARDQNTLKHLEEMRALKARLEDVTEAAHAEK